MNKNKNNKEAAKTYADLLQIDTNIEQGKLQYESACLDFAAGANWKDEQLGLYKGIPHISHFINEDGNKVGLNVEGINIILKRDGTLEFFRSFGFAGRINLTPVYKEV